jgi:RNA polymerase sigma-70 factor (ECF subfamily)
VSWRASYNPTADQPSDDDLALIEAAIADPAAFAPLYRQHAPVIYRYCYRQLGHPETAADATSQVFIKAIGGLRSFTPHPEHPGKTFSAWLFRIAGYVVIDHRRKERLHRSLDLPDDADDLAVSLADPGRSPEDVAVAGDDARTVRHALEKLPQRQRQIVELRLAGLTGDEIAEAMGTSLSAVKSAQFRAYTTLRQALSTTHPDHTGAS